MLWCRWTWESDPLTPDLCCRCLCASTRRTSRSSRRVWSAVRANASSTASASKRARRTSCDGRDRSDATAPLWSSWRLTKMDRWVTVSSHCTVSFQFDFGILFELFLIRKYLSDDWVENPSNRLLSRCIYYFCMTFQACMTFFFNTKEGILNNIWE